MQFKQDFKLLGVVAKKDSGTLENGTVWATDRVELHVLCDFDNGDTRAHGSTVSILKIQDCDAHYEAAKALVGQQVVVECEMVPPKTLGKQPTLVYRSFSRASVSDKTMVSK